MSACDVQKAIFDTLSQDAALMALLDGPKIYDVFPRDRDFPCVLIGPVNSGDWSNDTNEGEAIIATLVVWSDKTGLKQTYEIVDRIKELCGSLTVDATTASHIVLSQFLTSRHERDVTARLSKATVRFRILLEPAA